MDRRGIGDVELLAVCRDGLPAAGRVERIDDAAAKLAAGAKDEDSCSAAQMTLPQGEFGFWILEFGLASALWATHHSSLRVEL